jgi:polysaccharide pyruvyl transferase WcaK-like protein
VPKSKISGRMEEGIIKEVINYLLEKKAQVVLLPHSFNKSDDLANDFLFLQKFVKTESLDNKSEKICIKENMQEVYEVYKNKEIDFCFAMRLHSIILCQVY